MKAVVAALLGGIFLLFISGCSQSSSILLDAEKAFREVIQNGSKGQIVLTRFVKKNGREIDGATYELIYQAEVSFESSGTWITRSTLESGVGFNFRVPQGQQLRGSAAIAERDLIAGKDVVRGQKAIINGSMVGHKFENGWKFSIGEAQVGLL